MNTITPLAHSSQDGLEMQANFEHPEVQAAAIQQEWESFRYQDGLRWSKIQTIAAIEVAFFTGLYSAPKSESILMLVIFSILVTFIVFAICCLAEKDGRDAEYHMKRAEKLLPIKDTLKLTESKKVLWISGNCMMRIAMILLNVLNLAVLLKLVFSLPVCLSH